jgi:hypothetical protein
MYKVGQLTGWLLLAILGCSLGASAQNSRYRGPRDDRHHHQVTAPEGGSALGYLLLAAVSCGGAIALKRRKVEHEGSPA